MLPYDKITSRDDDAFPFDDFLKYPRLIQVDWREEEPNILDAFCNAIGMPPAAATLEMDDKTGYYRLIRGAAKADVPWGDEISAQHSMLLALQKVFGVFHSIRYLNIGIGDTGYFVVEKNDTWRQLESANPHVRWFFAPIELLPDVFKTDFKTISDAGRKYGGN